MKDNPTLPELIFFLTLYNAWRRDGGDEISMPSPVDIGKAIDCAIVRLKELNRLKKKSTSRGCRALK